MTPETTNAPAAAPEFPKKPSSGHGTSSAWSVEARCTLPHPKEIVGQLLDERWRQVGFADGAGKGVPDGPRWLFEGRAFGLVSYPAAQALRWWFVANAYAACQDNGLETRLVRHEIKYSRTATPVEADEATDQWKHRD